MRNLINIPPLQNFKEKLSFSKDIIWDVSQWLKSIGNFNALSFTL